MKIKAKSASISVNDASTTLKNQREYQIQVTTLKNNLISSHEEALTKREEARKVHQNYTTMVTKYEQQATVATETIMQGKAKISSLTETIKLHKLRVKEIETLKSRTHDEKDEKWEAEYAKWMEEENKL